MSAAAYRSALYFGRVTHRRIRPVEHRLEYKVFSMLIDLDELPALGRGLRWFSHGGFNLFSFKDADYGDTISADGGAPSDIASRMRATLAAQGVDGRGRIELLCYPRIFGYAFNPLAVYYCRNIADRLSAIVYEVRNTFGGRHSYLIPVAEETGAVVYQNADKMFHVSPFMDMDLHYRFRMKAPGDNVVMQICEADAEGPILHAAFQGERATLDDRALIRAFFNYPLMTIKVIGAIHWEAIKLMAKGMRLRGGSTPPQPVTVVRPR